MSSPKHDIAEHEVCTLRSQVGDWPAGTEGTAVGIYEDEVLLELSGLPMEEALDNLIFVPAEYQIVRRYVERARPALPGVETGPEDRFETAPGHQAQVDWSHEQPIRTSCGLELPLYGFHMTLGHSRDSFLGLVGSMDLVTFWACHRAAFAHFGGVPRELLYDRTKTVVRSHVGRQRHGETDSVFHPEALASAHHYGMRLRLCRARRAKNEGEGRVRRVLRP